MAITIGTKLGRYEIRAKLGQGGMGEVYLAEDTQLHRRVALKILPVDVSAHPDRMRRFKQEAKAAAALSHPHIAHVYEIGEIEGVSFIAMEFVEGEALAKKISEHPLPVSELLDLAIQITEALNEAHSKGLTHRDIKPSNIVINTRGQAKLLDFGLARSQRQSDAESSPEATTQVQTADGIVMGTVMYMSPEQALGQQVDHRSDIFSMGALLYEMATARLAFSGASTTAVIDRIVHAHPDAVSRFNYAVPAELERIIRKCLEKDKNRRYQSARELLVDLENLKRDSAPVNSLPMRLTVRSRRWPSWAVALTTVLVVAMSALGIYLWRHSRTPTDVEAIDSIVVLPLVNSGGDSTVEYLSDGITESIINSLSQVPTLRVVPRVSVFRYKGIQTDPLMVARDMNVRAVLTGRITKVMDELTVQMDLIDVGQNRQLWGAKYGRKTSDILSLEDEIATQVSDKLRLNLSSDEKRQLTKRFTEDPEAYQLYLNGRYHWRKYTKDELLKSIEYFQQATAKDPRYALAYSGMADAYVVLGVMFLPPNQVFPQAKAAAQKALALDETLAAGHISMAAYKLFYEWDWRGAQTEAQRARELSVAYDKAIEVNTNYDDEHHFYCQALDALGQPQESIAEMRKALVLDPISVSMNMEIGWSYYIARDYNRAIEQCSKASEIDPHFRDAHLCTAQAYEQRRMYDQALAELKKVEDIAPDDPAFLTELGYVYGLSGRRADALKLVEQLRKISMREYVDPTFIGLIYTALGDREEAFKWLDKAYEARSSWMTWLKVEPKFDPLRSDPRFNELMHRVGIASTT